MDGWLGRVRFKAKLPQPPHSCVREVEGLRRPLIDSLLLKLAVANLDELVGFSLELIEPLDDRAIGAFRQRGEIVSRKKRVAPEGLKYLDVARDVRLRRDDLAVFQNRMCCPS